MISITQWNKENRMSEKLSTIIDEFEDVGIIMTNKDEIIEFMNDELGLNVHHDIVITSPEIQTLRDALTSLQVFALSSDNEYFEELAEEALNILEVK